MRRMFSLKQLQEIADARVEALVEGGTLDNAKPLYFHPITIYNNQTDNQYSLTMIIINNDSNAFTRTSLKSYIKEKTGRFLLNGCYKTDTYYLSPSAISIANNVLYVIGVDNTGTMHSTSNAQINFETLVDNANDFTDNVNKIN